MLNPYRTTFRHFYKQIHSPIRSISHKRSYHSLKPIKTFKSFRRHTITPIRDLIRTQQRSISISIEPTPNPESLKFVFDDPILAPGVFAEFKSIGDTKKSPLAKILFRIEGVKYVYMGYDFIAVTKHEDQSWNLISPIIHSELMEYIPTGEMIISDDLNVGRDTEILPDDSEVVATIKELIDTRIRPTIQDDGGDLTYKGFIDDVVFVQLHGSCTGCPSSTITLKNGIERMLMHWIPEVTAVVAVESDEEYQRIANANSA